MNLLLTLLLSVFLAGTNAKERIYTGSTPAGRTVRHFLGIDDTDSVDFIRWKISIQNDRYTIQCNYGIGKPNTNGFIAGGKWIRLRGAPEKRGDRYRLQNGDNVLEMYVVNPDLVHLMDEHNHLLVGNEGWSYTLNSNEPMPSDQLNLLVNQTQLSDSMVFVGRTPCLPFTYERRSPSCYKLKWSLVFYTDPKTHRATTYYLRGTAVNHERRSGTWNIAKGKDGRIIYRLLSANREELQLVVLDENLLVFADQQGDLLAGNEDFSFTLNRKQ